MDVFDSGSGVEQQMSRKTKVTFAVYYIIPDLIHYNDKKLNGVVLNDASMPYKQLVSLH